MHRFECARAHSDVLNLHRLTLEYVCVCTYVNVHMSSLSYSFPLTLSFFSSLFSLSPVISFLSLLRSLLRPRAGIADKHRSVGSNGRGHPERRTWRLALCRFVFRLFECLCVCARARVRAHTQRACARTHKHTNTHTHRRRQGKTRERQEGQRRGRGQQIGHFD